MPSGSGRAPAAAGVALAMLLGACWNEPAASPPTAGSLERSLHYTPERAERLVADRDQAIAVCMEERGFRWLGAPPEPQLTASPHGLYQLETPQATRDYRLRYGYGVVQQVYVLQQTGRQFRRGDPQTRYVARLDPTSRDDYEAALFGDAVVGGRGCTQRAIAATGGPAALGDDTELVRTYGDAIHDYLNDPRVERIEARVLECMREEGFEYENFEAIETRFQLELNELVGGEATFDARGRLHFSWGPGRSGKLRIARAPLERLLEQELETAAREVQCRDEYRSELGDILAEYSAPVIEEYRAQIERAAAAYLSAAERGGG